MIPLINKIAAWQMKRRLSRIDAFISHPWQAQQAQFDNLIDKAKDTIWGKQYDYRSIQSIDTFRERVPINSYETFYPYIERCLKGESDVLWRGKVKWFAKSSGTTNDKSKFIPITDDSFEDCHFCGGKDLTAMYLDCYPDHQLFMGRGLSIGGSHEVTHLNAEARAGDLSAVLMANLPLIFEILRTPSKKVALMGHWEEKLEAIANETMDQNIVSLVGVPTWTMLLINYILERKGITDRDIHKVWPNLEVFFHGGVSFTPYRSQFDAVTPNRKLNFIESYNASEGFFSMQNEVGKDDMLLMLDYGIFYEFIPMEHIDEEHPPTHTLEEVEVGRNYAMVISTNGGLWRYLIGDTIVFTSISPFKIKITGRTKHFINAFGEELMVDNADMALAEACEATGAIIVNYTAAPIYIAGTQGGGHEWIVEFERAPSDERRFVEVLDDTLKRLNSDYEAKRAGDMALLFPTFHRVPEGTFYEWMKRRGKLGGQNKVPRLSNNRRYVEEILGML